MEPAAGSSSAGALSWNVEEEHGNQPEMAGVAASVVVANSELVTAASVSGRNETRMVSGDLYQTSARGVDAWQIGE